MASQLKVPSYSRPPVREAIIDIQIDALSEELLPKLKECGTEFESLNPTPVSYTHLTLPTTPYV